MKKLLSAILAMAMVFAMSIPAFAAETQESSEEFTLAEAAELLGVPEEELAGMKIQRLSSLGANTNGRALPTNLESGNVYYEDITAGSFTGAIHRINGTNFKWVAKLMSTVNTYPISFLIQRWDTDCTYYRDACTLYDAGDQYDSGWCSEAYGQEFYFKYYLSGPNSEDNVVRIAVAVY